MADPPLPSYQSPPVVETVIGVQFAHIPGFTNAHLGVFWTKLGPDWPLVNDAPQLDPEFEQFDVPGAWHQGLRFRFGQDPAARLQIQNRDKTRMVQVQNGRLIYNWIAREGDGYPSYGKIRPGFDETLTKFAEFLREQDLGAPAYNQWEITYVNHIHKGTVWEEPVDWPSLFRAPLVLPALGKDIAQLESMGGEWHFELPPRRGRLHIQLQHLIEVGPGPDQRNRIVLKLTARGPIRPTEPDFSMDSGLSLGHATIVRAFTSITSDAAHAYWRREH